MLGDSGSLSDIGRYVTAWLRGPGGSSAGSRSSGGVEVSRSASNGRAGAAGRGAPATGDTDHHFQFVPGEDSVSGAVVAAAASVHDVDELALRPLADVVDPDALDDVFAPGMGDTVPTPGAMVLHYEGLEIEIDSGGHVHVRVS